MILPEHHYIKYHKIKSKQCTKFNPFYKGYTDHARAIVCLKLLSEGNNFILEKKYIFNKNF